MTSKLSWMGMMICAVLFLASCGGQEKSEATDTSTKKEEKKVNEKPEEKKLSKAGYQVGDEVADFSLKNIDDEMVALSDYKDEEGVIVVFTCNTCPYAVAYEDRINDLHNNLASEGYPVLAVNPNDPEVKPGDSFDAMKVRAEEKDFQFAYVFDEGQSVYPSWGATRTPEVYIIKNVDGKMKLVYTGAIDDNHKDPKAVSVNYIKEAVAALKEGKEPTPNFTKAIGCSIKKKS
ncbi:MAG: thioredoxin family protein [Bacteroidota bacterium]